jgi:3-oxoacyl-(acyl-carrier-protein) synthase
VTFLVLETAESALTRGGRVYGELAGAAWGNLPTPAHGFPSLRRRDPVTVRRALASAGVAPETLETTYLTGSGHPEHDACELDLVARVLGGGRARLTALTPLVGEHAGLGALRAAAAALAVAGSGVPGLDDLSEPIRHDLRFAVRHESRGEGAPAPALVHGLARGGTHVALVLRPFGEDWKAAA